MRHSKLINVSIFAILLVIMTINLVSAIPPVFSTMQPGSLEILTPGWDAIKQSQDREFFWHLFNTSTYLSNVTANCSFHLYSSEGKGEHLVQINNVPTFSNGLDFEVEVKGNNFSTLGEYSYFIECITPNGQTGAIEVPFIVNPTGEASLTTGTTLLYLFILGILCLFLIASIFSINKAVNAEWQIFYICASYLLLFSLFFIFWLLSKNYLYQIPLLASVSWITWIILGGLFFPFIIVVSSYIMKKQAEALLTDDYQKQGYTKEESLNMAKR